MTASRKPGKRQENDRLVSAKTLWRNGARGGQSPMPNRMPVNFSIVRKVSLVPARQPKPIRTDVKFLAVFCMVWGLRPRLLLWG